MIPWLSRQWRFVVIGLGTLVVCVAPAVVQAQNVTQTYGSTQQLQVGMVVQLDPKDPKKVIPVSRENEGKTHGVVVAANDAPVSLTQSDPKIQQYYVATYGQYRVLVSDQNGPIAKGDYIGISSIAGVGMKASDDETIVLGKALNDFAGTATNVSTVVLKDANGNDHPTHLGYTNIDVSVAHNPNHVTQSNLPGFLQKTGQAIADKPVSLKRVYLGFSIIIMSTLIAGSVLYAGVRTSMVAVGRNPLARKSIMRDLLQVIVTSMIVFLMGVFGVYLLLKL